MIGSPTNQGQRSTCCRESDYPRSHPGVKQIQVSHTFPFKGIYQAFTCLSQQKPDPMGASPKVRVYSHWPSSDVLATALHPAGREASITWGMVNYENDDEEEGDGFL